MISSYSSIYNLGHKLLDSLFQGPVQIEEKVDGSQFSFKKEGDTIQFRSKGREIFPPTDDKLFKPAVDYITSIGHLVRPGYTYRGEVLARPKHNSIAYDRVPNHNIVIFDIDTGIQRYQSYEEKVALAKELDLEVVPSIYYGEVKDVETLREFLSRDSFLGGAKIEGIVIKNYEQYAKDKKTLMGKWVSEAFKEKNSKEWKRANPGSNDVIQNIIHEYKHENRWLKAVQHLNENGVLLNEPKDIGHLMKEVSVDVHKECADEIKEKLFKYAWPKISRGITSGLPEWYKNKLAESQFEKGGTNVELKTIREEAETKELQEKRA